jgi:hypothetical protein
MSTGPALRYLFQVLETMYNVSIGILVREIQQMNSTGRVGHINGNVTDLTKSIRLFISSKMFGYHRSSMSAVLFGRHMRWEGRCGLGVLQEWSVKMDVKKLKEHATIISAALTQRHIQFCKTYCMSKT